MAAQFKSRISRSIDTYGDATYLASCSDESAAAWLCNRPASISWVMGTIQTPPDAHLLEYILLRRQRPAIDRALAQYGRSATVLERLYERAGASLRVVACSNASLFIGETFGSSWREKSLLWDIIFNGPTSELRAICENPDLPSGFYGGLVTSWVPESERKDDKSYLAEDRFIAVIRYLSANPRISLAREDSPERNYKDGYADYDYHRLFTHGWRLAEVAPVTAEWGEALAGLYQRLLVPFKCIENVDAAIARWQVADEKEFSPTQLVREALAVAFVKPTLDQLNDDDVAMRNAFYRSFDPDQSEFKHLEWEEWIDDDRHVYFTLRQNDRIWASSAGRRKLRNMLWHGTKRDNDLFQVSDFDEREEELRSLHPEWFADDDGNEINEVPEREHVPAPIDQLRGEIRALISALDQRRASVVWIAGAAILGLVVGLAIG